VIETVDITIVHSRYEQELLARETPGSKVYLFPWILDPEGRQASFGQRHEIMFLGGYRHRPNVDAAEYFVKAVWPLIRVQLPRATFHIVGANAPPELLALGRHRGVVVDGFVDDLRSAFERARISVAPIRYGAGIKGKVAMSMAHGVPVVATQCAAEGMDLIDDENVLIADTPEEMAAAVVALYRDPERWLALSDAGLDFVTRQYGSALGRRRVAEILDLAGVAPVATSELLKGTVD
jgi:O-antigen biosynthesis protein